MWGSNRGANSFPSHFGTTARTPEPQFDHNYINTSHYRGQHSEILESTSSPILDFLIHQLPVHARFHRKDSLYVYVLCGIDTLVPGPRTAVDPHKANNASRGFSRL